MDRGWLKLTLILAALSVVGCASQSQKERKAQREGLMKSSKMYCEYINGEQYQDIDVFLNIQMGSKCDVEKPYAISQYRTPSDIQGMMFCCGLNHKALQADASDAAAAATSKKDKKDAKKDEKSDLE